VMERDAQEEEVAVLESIYGDDFRRLGDKEFQVELRPLLASSTSPTDGLQPAVLRFSFHGRYPSEPPDFSISASWLRREDEKTTKRALLALFEEQKGSVVIFNWIEWLRENMLTCIGWTASDYAAHLEASRGRHARAEQPDTSAQPETRVPWIRGEALTDRKSKFVAHLVRVESVEEVDIAMADLLRDKKVANATHNIAAYRIIGSDGRLISFRDDDGETGAGDKLLYLLERMGVTNTLVVVTRWYGGVHLGPDRFKHITGVAKQLIEEVMGPKKLSHKAKPIVRSSQ